MHDLNLSAYKSGVYTNPYSNPSKPDSVSSVEIETKPDETKETKKEQKEYPFGNKIEDKASISSEAKKMFESESKKTDDKVDRKEKSDHEKENEQKVNSDKKVESESKKTDDKVDRKEKSDHEKENEQKVNSDKKEKTFHEKFQI